MKLPNLDDITRMSGNTAPKTFPDMSKLLPHIWAILFFIGVSGLWAFYSWNTGVEQIKQSDTTGIYFSVVMQYKHEREAMTPSQKAEWQWPTLLKQVLADQRILLTTTGVDSLYQASFMRYFGTVYRVTGDVTLGYKILVFPLNLLFLLGAYALFFHLTEKALLASVFAFLATFPIAIPIAGEYFGMGPVTIFSRRNLFTAFAPFAIFLFYRWIQKPRLLLMAFVFVGLISNLHASGILLAEILMAAYFFYPDKKSDLRGYAAIFGLLVVIFGFMSVGGLWSRIASYFWGLAQQVIPNPQASISDFMQKQGIPEGLEFLFYPLRIYSHLPLFLLHVMTLFVALLSGGMFFFGHKVNAHIRTPLLFLAGLTVLAYLGFSEFKYFLLLGVVAFALSWKREIDPKFELTHYLILAIFFVSFIGMLLFQAGYYAIEGFPLVFDQLRGTRFLGLMVFVWLAVLVSRMEWRSSGVWGKRLFIVCVALVMLMTLRHDFRSWIYYKDDPDSTALLDLARWSKDNTPGDAAFLVVSTRFGIVAERNVFLHDRESHTTNGQMLLDRMQGGLAELKQLAREKGMSYIVVKKDREGLLSGTIPVYDNKRFALVKVN